MRKYWAVFRVRFVHGAQYRIVVFSHLATALLWGWMSVLAYVAFHRADPSAFPMTLSQTVTYMWLQQMFLILFEVVFGDGEIESAIQGGAIAYELVRPADLYGRWYARACAGRAVVTLFRLPMLLIVLLLPAPFRMALPASPGALALFVPSAVLALGVAVSIAMLMYVVMFYTTSFGGIRVMVIALMSFVSGSVVPYPFLPAPVRLVLERLPFAAMQNMPFRIYVGDIAGLDALWGLAFQAFWLVALVAIGRGAMRRALGKIVVQGG